MNKNKLGVIVSGIIWAIIVIAVFSSCAQLKEARTKRKCMRSVKFAQEHGCLTEKSDTIWKLDTIKGWNYDTIVKYDSTHISDTLFTSNGKDSIITIVKWKERTIRQIKTEKDTIIKTAEITREKIVEKPLKWYQRLWWWWIAVTMAFCILMINISNKISNIR